MRRDRAGGRGTGDRRRARWSGVIGPAVALSVAAMGSSCFDGGDALGLPCRTDDDCGQDQACEQGFCGGPPPTSSAGSSSGPGGSTTTTTTATTEADSSSGTTEGLDPECGNGLVEGSEECDSGPEGGADCDPDCTAVMCGDGFINELAGELCDDGNTSSFDECNEDCLPNLFWDDMEDPMRSLGQWTPSEPETTFGTETYSLPKGSGWQLGLPGMPDVGVWFSGIYSEDAGLARLATSEIMFPPLPGPGIRYELRFRHTYRFDGNQSIDVECPKLAHTDGALVWIVDPMQEPRPLAPQMGQGVPLSDLGGCSGTTPNPLFILDPAPNVYSGATMEMFQDVAVPLGPVAPSAQIVFDLGYDCSNCWGMGPAGMQPPVPGWVLDEVVVGMFRF